MPLGVVIPYLLVVLRRTAQQDFLARKINARQNSCLSPEIKMEWWQLYTSRLPILTNMDFESDTKSLAIFGPDRNAIAESSCSKWQCTAWPIFSSCRRAEWSWATKITQFVFISLVFIRVHSWLNIRGTDCTRGKFVTPLC